MAGEIQTFEIEISEEGMELLKQVAASLPKGTDLSPEDPRMIEIMKAMEGHISHRECPNVDAPAQSAVP
jgi:hypothetical protein